MFSECPLDPCTHGTPVRVGGASLLLTHHLSLCRKASGSDRCSDLQIPQTSSPSPRPLLPEVSAVVWRSAVRSEGPPTLSASLTDSLSGYHSPPEWPGEMVGDGGWGMNQRELHLLPLFVTVDNCSVRLFHTAGGRGWNGVWGHGNEILPTSRAGSRPVSCRQLSGGHSGHSAPAVSADSCLTPSGEKEGVRKRRRDR